MNKVQTNITFPLCMQTMFKNINMFVCIFAYMLPNRKETGEIFMKVGECEDKEGNRAHMVRNQVNSLGQRRESAWGSTKERVGWGTSGNKAEYYVKRKSFHLYADSKKITEINRS